MTSATDPWEVRVLICAAGESDARSLAAILGEEGLVGEVCPSMADVCRKMREGAGAALLAEESLTAEALAQLRRALAEQPPWSDFPLILLIRGCESAPDDRQRFEVLESLGNVTLVERSVRMITLVSTARAALRARRRQYQVRDHLADRQQAEEALRASEQRFARFMQHLPGLAWIKDADGHYVYANDAAEKAFRTPLDQLYGKTDEEIFPPATAALFRENDRQARNSPTGVQVIETLEHEDGILHYSIVSKFPIPGPDDERVLTGGMAIDITDHKRAEEALRRSEAQFRQLADALPQIVWTARPDGFIDYYNERWYEFTGFPRGEYGEASWKPILHPDDAERCVETYFGCIRSGQLYQIEYRFKDRSTGGYRWFLGRAYPVRDEEGRIVRWFGTCTDIDDTKRAEEALKEADRRKDEFLATLAHELRNPLAPIRYGLQLLRLPAHSGPMLEQTFTMLERQMGQMVRLIDDLLDVSRITRSKLELRKERVELDTVVKSAVETSRPLMEAFGHELFVSLPPEPVVLDGDLTRLAQVFANLLNNSARYTAHGGRIHLLAARQGNDIVVSVKDTGAGISAEMLPHVFEMFMQGDRSLERRQGGLGIGLTLVKRLVEMHGGSVEARSEGLGRGSEFLVRLPVVSTPAPSEYPRPHSNGTTGTTGLPARILVVDDNEDAARSLSLLLRHRGHEVRTAHDGVEAVTAATEFRPAIAILDIGLPKLNGYDVARRIRSEPWGQDVMLIALTGWGQGEDKLRAREAGFDHHLTKPVDPAELLHLLLDAQRPQ
jgi:PAS domain S-box-containing protein